MEPSERARLGKFRRTAAVAALLLLALFGCAPVQIGSVSIPADATEASLQNAGVTDVSALQRLTKLTSLDLRGNEIAAADFDALQAALPACEILWSVPVLDGSRADSDSRTLTLPDFSEDTAALLAYFPGLRRVDATGSSAYAALREAAARYPDCTFYWTVPVGTEAVPCTAVELCFPAAEASFSDVETAFSGLPELRRADLTKTALDTAAAVRLAEAFPEVELTYRATFGSVAAPSDATALDLTGCGETDADALCSALQFFRSLRSVRWADCTLTPEEQLRLLAVCPDAVFDWPVVLLDGVSVSSSATELILSGHPVTDLPALEKQLLLFPQLETLELCNCGPDDATLAALRARHPELKVVWMLHVGVYDLRTDISAFSLGHSSAFPGGQVRAGAHAGARYQQMTSEDLEPLQYATELVALDVGHAENIASLEILRKLKKLRFLIVAQVSATDLSPLCELTELEYFEAFSTDITDFSPIAGCKKLQYLNLCNTSFADPGVVAELRNLKRLWIGQTPLTLEQCNALRAALPDCRVEWRGRHPTDRWRIGNEGYFEMQKLFGLHCLT